MILSQKTRLLLCSSVVVPMTAFFLLCASSAFAQISQHAASFGHDHQGAGYFAYWYVDSTTTSTLEIANHGEQTKVLDVVAYVRGVDPVSLGTIQVLPGLTARLSLDASELGGTAGPSPTNGSVVAPAASPKPWGTGARPRSSWGSLSVLGDMSGLTGWILVQSPAESISTNPMMTGNDRGSSGLSAHWWMRTSNTDALYAVSNLGGRRATVVPSLNVGGRSLSGRPIVLEPTQATLFVLSELAAEFGLTPSAFGKNGAPSSGFVRFEAVEPNSVLTGHGTLVDETMGFSTPLPLHPIGRHAALELQSPGMPFGAADAATGFPPGTSFSPHLLVSNPHRGGCSFQVAIQGESLADGNWEEWPVLDKRLGSGESLVLDLRHTAIKSRLPVADGMIGVVVRQTFGTRAIQADLVVHDDTLTYSFFDPLFDAARTSHGSVAISFDLTETKNTHFVIKNVSDESQSGLCRLQYAQADGTKGEYVLRLVIAPQNLQVIDIRALRDQGVPDIIGRVLPIDVEHGNGFLNGAPALIMGDPTFDVVTGTCLSCAPDPGNCSFFPLRRDLGEDQFLDAHRRYAVRRFPELRRQYDLLPNASRFREELFYR